MGRDAERGVIPPQAEGRSGPKKLEGARKVLPGRHRRGRSPADSLISDFWPSEPRKNKFPLPYAPRFVVVCCSRSRKQTQGPPRTAGQPCLP